MRPTGTYGPDRDGAHRRRPAHGQGHRRTGPHPRRPFRVAGQGKPRALFDALDELPWQTVPITHSSTDKGHGRITTRTVQVMPAPDGLPFPHVAQVWLIERYVTNLDGIPISAIAQLGITSLDTDLGTPADLARYNQHHWGIEVLHWIRDTLFREDQSRIRTRNGPRVMASLRNLAISALRLAGRTDITEATRWACRNMNRPFAILKLTYWSRNGRVPGRE